MTRFLAAIAVLVVCAAVPAAAGAQPPPNPPDLRITTTPNPVKFGEDVRIFGELTRRPGSGIAIELSEDPFPFDAFATVATALTDAGSGYYVHPYADGQHPLSDAPGCHHEPDCHGAGQAVHLAPGEQPQAGDGSKREVLGPGLPGARRRLACDPAPHGTEALAKGSANDARRPPPAARVPATRAGCGSAAAASTARSFRHTPTTPMAVAGNAGSTCPDRRRPAIPTCRLPPALAQPATTHSAARASKQTARV